MKKVYYLSTCSTCKRILDRLNTQILELIDIKKTPVNANDLDLAAEKLGGYEVLFNKRAMKYKSNGLNNKKLTEENFRKLILEEYTFLKRPLFLIGEEAYAGNSQKVVEIVKSKLEKD